MPAEKNKVDRPVEKTEVEPAKPRRNMRKPLVIAGVIVAVIIGIFAVLRSYQYAATPAVIRNPSVDHYHFRTQLFYDGQAVNFAEEQFQETYVGGQCSADLPETPIHFHDNADQMTHIHWNGMTGGMLLKYYGLNLIGGPDGKLGWRFDRSPLMPEAVSIRTDALQDIPAGSEAYVFIKTDDGFKEKPFSEFLEQDFETFFEKRSNLGEASGGWLEWLMPKAEAHAGENHGAEVGSENVDLQQLNNLLGDVVIFIQPERPSDEQVTEAFNNLVELSQTTCGG